MPGFTLIYKQDGIDDALAKRAERLVNSNFKVQYISKKKKLIILFKDGINYPYEVIEKRKYIVLIEGKMYGIKPTADKIFLEHIDVLFSESINNISEKSQQSLDFIYSLDGEFVIYIVDKKGEQVLVLNDYLGRLPLYLFNQKRFVLSRDLALMDKLTTGLVFNEAAVYQYMRLGFPLGNRTLFYDTERLAPSSFVHISNENVVIKSSTTSLSELENTLPKNENSAECLYEEFRSSVSRRLETNEKCVLSLSGGLDSRTILGISVKEKYHLDLASFEYDNPIIQNDILAVRQFSKMYERTPDFLKVNEWSPEFFDELTLAKSGMNNLGMTFILHFLRKLSNNYQLMITGDGGDKTLPYLFPLHSAKKFENLLIRNNQFSKAKLNESFFSFKTKTFEEEIIQYLKDIPEIRNQLKYKHFLLFERGRNWLFEGEDRNRSYLWSTSPYYSPQFFKLAHSIPEKKKEKFRLFREFTNLVDSRLNSIPNANWGFPLADERRVNKLVFRQKLKERLRYSRKGKVAESVQKSILEDTIGNLLQRGYGGQVSIVTNKDVLSSLNENMLYHMLSLLKVSEFLWKPF